MSTRPLHVFSNGEGDFFLAHDKADLEACLREATHITFDSEEDLLEQFEEFEQLADDQVLREEDDPPGTGETCAWWCENYGRGELGTPKTEAVAS